MADFEISRARAAELKEQLNYHIKRYYDEDAPEISDYEYDMLMRELKAIEEEFPQLVTADSPTRPEKIRWAPIPSPIPPLTLPEMFPGRQLSPYRF